MSAPNPADFPLSSRSPDGIPSSHVAARAVSSLAQAGGKLDEVGSLAQKYRGFLVEVLPVCLGAISKQHAESVHRMSDRVGALSAELDKANTLMAELARVVDMRLASSRLECERNASAMRRSPSENEVRGRLAISHAISIATRARISAALAQLHKP